MRFDSVLILADMLVRFQPVPLIRSIGVMVAPQSSKLIVAVRICYTAPDLLKINNRKKSQQQRLPLIKVERGI